jgi:dephospho-CoA kinase
MTIARCPVVGLVGGIGAGKSRVSAALARRGGRLVAGDPLGHAALRQPEVIRAVVDRFGPGVLDDSEDVDRAKLGAVVFADPAARRALEAIVHPWIGQRLRAELAAARADPGVPFAVLDAAIMLEAGWESAGVHPRPAGGAPAAGGRAARLVAGRGRRPRGGATAAGGESPPGRPGTG